MTAPRIWIVVADGETARIYSALGRTARLEQALPYELRMPDPPTREQGADKPGRVFDSHGAGRHAIQPHADWHREAKHQFAREIAELLKRKAQEDQFDELVVVAPPPVMGDLRKDFDEHTKARVKAEVTKDLTKLSPTELQDYLTREVWS